VGVFIDFGLGFEGKAIGVENWYNSGASHNGWVGFINVLVMAAFAYSGSEMVGLTASEQERPARDMPKAVSVG
jgi:amino acid transporter